MRRVDQERRLPERGGTGPIGPDSLTVAANVTRWRRCVASQGLRVAPLRHNSGLLSGQLVTARKLVWPLEWGERPVVPDTLQIWVAPRGARGGSLC